MHLCMCVLHVCVYAYEQKCMYVYSDLTGVRLPPACMVVLKNTFRFRTRLLFSRCSFQPGWHNLGSRACMFVQPGARLSRGRSSCVHCLEEPFRTPCRAAGATFMKVLLVLVQIVGTF